MAHNIKMLQLVVHTARGNS